MRDSQHEITPKVVATPHPTSSRKRPLSTSAVTATAPYNMPSEIKAGEPADREAEHLRDDVENTKQPQEVLVRQEVGHFQAPWGNTGGGAAAPSQDRNLNGVLGAIQSCLPQPLQAL